MSERKKLILCLGPVCSGKTTWSLNYIKENPDFFRISFDEFRAMGFGSMKSDKVDDRFMHVLNNSIINASFFYKKIVIDGFLLDIDQLSVLLTQTQAYDIQLKLFDVKTSDAINRNKLRKEKGGHYLENTELLRYNKFYKEFVTSDDFIHFIKSCNIEVTMDDFCDVNLYFVT